MNKNVLIRKIKLLEGLTDDEKSALLELLRSQKKYGLVWEDKPEKVEQQLEEELPVFTEVKERAISCDDPSAPNHILIEGDNLHALTALTYTHEGKIDVIYIDPPYNTGNKDFIYNDSFVDREDEYRHSKWLSFMKKRLEIAKQLLSEKGVIFISIDDNECAQLKLLCDEVFTSLNFCGQFIWRKKSGGGQTDAFFVTEHEYVFVYQSSSKFSWIDPQKIISQDNFKYEDERGKFNIVKLEKWGSSAHREDRPSMYFPIKNPKGEDYYPIAPDGKNGRWRVGLKRMKNIIDSNRIEWKNGIPYEKNYHDESITIMKTQKSRSILYNIGETGDGSKLLTNILGEKDTFQNPKPLSLAKELLSHNKANTVLDFFAGSGTTLHATMQLNAEDGGHRQCILVTNNENNICEEVTYERNKRVIEGYTTPKGEEVEGLHNNTLRYYRTNFIPREQTNKNKRALVTAATDLLCIKNNVYVEQYTFGGRKLKPNAARYFDDEKTRMLVIYNEQVIDAFVSVLRNIEVEGKIMVYVFSNNRYAYNDNFEEVREKVELCALPAAIYDAYKKVLKPHKKKERNMQEPLVESNEKYDIQEELNFSEEGGTVHD
jgi:Adenine specific DNA methylase Mod